MSTRVSAIVVTYRSREVVLPLLEDLREAVDEVVVVDNASEDGTVEAVRQAAPWAQCVERYDNGGFAAGVNAGVAAASGRLLLLVNPDARVHPGAVDALLAAAERHPGDILGPRVRYPDGRLQPSRSGVPSVWTLLGEQLLVPEGARPGSWPARLWPRWRGYDREEQGPILSGCALLIPRETWDRVGPFDERFFLFWEEVDWQVRARDLGHRAWLVPEAEVVHGRGGSSDVGDRRRTELYYAAAVTYLDKWTWGWTRRLALTVLWLGQAARLAAWSLPPARGRPAAPGKRDAHRTAMRVLRGRANDGASGPPGTST